MPDASSSTSTDPLAACRTVADLLEHLGGIPADRVWLHPAPGTATEQDVIGAGADRATSAGEAEAVRDPQ